MSSYEFLRKESPRQIWNQVFRGFNNIFLNARLYASTRLLPLVCGYNIRIILQYLWLFCARTNNRDFHQEVLVSPLSFSFSGVWDVLSPTKTCWNWWYSTVQWERTKKKKSLLLLQDKNISHSGKSRLIWNSYYGDVLLWWWHLWATAIFIF